jgi:hypothetical protein
MTDIINTDRPLADPPPETNLPRPILYPEDPDQPRQHWHDCWQFVGHHGCAIDRVFKLEERLEELRRNYEELRKVIDGGSESMTHADAVQEVKDLQYMAEGPRRWQDLPTLPTTDG